MNVLYSNENILEVTSSANIADSMSSLHQRVYQCAEKNLSVGETVHIASQPYNSVEKVIIELVSLQLIKVKKLTATNTETVKGIVNDSLLSEIDNFYEKLLHCNYYELLGLDFDAARVEIRNQYFELSKRYHPDKAFGQMSKVYIDKMARIFKQLTLAYDILSNPQKKSEYDTSIRDEIEFKMMEKKLNEAIQEKNRTVSSAVTELSENISQNTTFPPPKTKDKLSSFSNLSDNSIIMRREQLKRKLDERTLNNLINHVSQVPLRKNEEQIETLLENAELALEQHRYSDVQIFCKKILNSYPDNEKAKKCMDLADEKQTQMQIKMHLSKGRYSFREGLIKEAKQHFQQALALDSKNIEARHSLAELLIRHEKDFSTALVLMKEVIILGGQCAGYFVTLGDIFYAVKDMDRAQDAYNRALKMEPQNKEVKKRLRLCKK